VTLVAEGPAGPIDLGLATLPARVGMGNRALRDALRWEDGAAGIRVARLDLRAGAFGIAVQAIVVRADPARLRFALQRGVADNGMTGTWTIDSLPRRAVLGMNAGQFKETGPWGWLVVRGEELRNPLRAPLAIGIRIDTTGRLRWVPPAHEAEWRHDPGTAYAFQSFPYLYFDRQLSPVLRDGGTTDLGHRDARLVLAEADDGATLFVLTRYAGLGTLTERVPIGLTTPECVALLAALGARHAVMLDGGVSAQLLLRDGAGAGVERRWAGLRRVPLALVAEPRPEH